MTTETMTKKAWPPRTGRSIIVTAQLQYGFVTDEELAILAGDPETRLTPVLVRCGNGRFICAAQDAKHFIDAIEKAQADYIRDVSIYSGSK